MHVISFMIRAIMFDLWNTIAKKDISEKRVLRDHFQIKKENYERVYYRALEMQRWNTEKAWAKKFLETFDIPITDENIQLIVNKTQEGIRFTKLLPGMTEILELLKHSYKLILLSNSHNFETVVLDNFKIRHLFDVVVFSYDVGLLKPDRKIFEIAASQAQVQLPECLLVDDLPEYIEKAREYGMQAVQFKNQEQLRRDLSNLSILIE